MLAIERRNAILEKLRIEKRVVVSELSQIYDVSEETIRRDLEKLENDGFATKSYGGAVLNENTNLEFPFNVRKKWNVAEKQKIAEIISGRGTDYPGCQLYGGGYRQAAQREEKPYTYYEFRRDYHRDGGHAVGMEDIVHRRDTERERSCAGGPSDGEDAAFLPCR